MRCIFIDKYNDESYEVQTHWGRFRLDRRSYEDYLAGKLWISWMPGRQNQMTSSAPADAVLPPNVTEEAIRLRDLASRQGFYPVLQAAFPGRQAEVPYHRRLRDKTIDELALSARSVNCLMRANANTFGRLRDLIAREDGLRSVRNLGVKSEAEIRRCFFEACYSCLTPGEQAIYWQEAIDSNT